DVPVVCVGFHHVGPCVRPVGVIHGGSAHPCSSTSVSPESHSNTSARIRPACPTREPVEHTAVMYGALQTAINAVPRVGRGHGIYDPQPRSRASFVVSLIPPRSALDRARERRQLILGSLIGRGGAVTIRAS